LNLFYPITHSDEPAIREWDENPKNVCTGIDFRCDNVYSYSSGVVLAIGRFNDYYCVTVQYDIFNLLRYDHLKSVDVGAGDIIQVDALIGMADHFLHFEYATKEQNSSKWSVRVGSQTYWKQNPMEMILND
jgi:hypothetical protein